MVKKQTSVSISRVSHRELKEYFEKNKARFRHQGVKSLSGLVEKMIFYYIETFPKG